jgi:hypothetical protein
MIDFIDSLLHVQILEQAVIFSGFAHFEVNWLYDLLTQVSAIFAISLI